MQTDKRTQHVERIEAPEQSSAGWQTQHLVPPLQPSASQSTIGAQNHNRVALALIAIGVLVWLGRIVPDPGAVTGGLVLLTIASGILFFALWRRIYGLLIPGCILAGLSVGIPFAEITNGISVLWGLALGFMAILLVGRSFFNIRSPWPVFPAVPLFCIGMIVAVANLPTFLGASLIWLPLLLIGAGLYLGSRRQHP